jgi:hypothetical protein
MTAIEQQIRGLFKDVIKKLAIKGNVKNTDISILFGMGVDGELIYKLTLQEFEKVVDFKTIISFSDNWLLKKAGEMAKSMIEGHIKSLFDTVSKSEKIEKENIKIAIKSTVELGDFSELNDLKAVLYDIDCEVRILEVSEFVK